MGKTGARNLGTRQSPISSAPGTHRARSDGARPERGLQRCFRRVRVPPEDDGDAGGSAAGCTGRLVPLVGGSRDMKPPPAAVLRLLTRIHPAFRRNERLAGRTFANKLMRTELDRWEREWKPSLDQEEPRLHRGRPGGARRRGLVRHLRALHAHILETGALHFRLHVVDMGPIGDLMVHLEDWGLRAERHVPGARCRLARRPASRRISSERLPTLCATQASIPRR